MDEQHNTHKPSASADDANNPAVNIIRDKISNLYVAEPDVKEEIVDANEAGQHRSKHQAFMHKLSTSGKSLAEIQTQWHHYYVSLPDSEKHAVWQEFYAMHGTAPHLQPQHRAAQKAPPHHHTQPKPSVPHHRPSRPRSVADIKNHLLSKVGARGKLSKKHHVQSILFGLGVGATVLIVVLFSFFNERFITPFITPSRNVSSTPIVIDPNFTAVSSEPTVVIPKINVEAPVVYDQPSIDEKAIQKSLENGVVHYATTPNPGQRGNNVIVGHSSNNIFNQGRYKFAFMLLNRLEVGDTFYLTKDSKRYVYRVYEKRIIKPTDVSILGNTDRLATTTLITCDPPGTATNRLIVIGEQITPDPSQNTDSTVAAGEAQSSLLPGNAPSLWQRFKDWVFS